MMRHCGPHARGVVGASRSCIRQQRPPAPQRPPQLLPTAPAQPRRGSATGAASARSYGPEPPPPRPTARGSKPEWVRILEEDAGVDEDVAELLQGTGGDPERIRAKMEAQLQRRELIREGSGVEAPPSVLFREVDQFDMWVWLELCTPLTASERDMLSSALKSWYIVGKLGGFNAGNMQVYHNASGDLSYMDYDNDELRRGAGMASFMHDMGDPEFNGGMARFKVDLGTADEVALDVLINTLAGFSRDVAGVARVVFGGTELNGWALGAGAARGGGGMPPKVGIDPMRVPEGMDDELALLDELDAMQSDIDRSEELAAEVGGGPLFAGGAGGWSRRGPAAGAARDAGGAGSGSAGGSGGGSGGGGGSPLGGPPPVASGRQRRRGGGGGQPARPEPRLPEQGMSVYGEEEFRRQFPSRGRGGE